MSKVEVDQPSHENKLNLESADKSSGSCEFTLEIESDDEEENLSKPFVPKVKIKKLDESILIETYVLKDVALTSGLFLILEEDEKLEIVYENQYRTETKVSHTLQVKVQEGYNIEALEMKLCM